MTQYQQIENELLSLGWTPEQGRGDHVKFRKDGNQDMLIISKSVKGGRSLLNCYADIRRKEPQFTLGRPVKAKKDIEQTPEFLKMLPVWLQPGAPVRWLLPEQFELDKLNDPSSIMNLKYTVTGYKDEENDLAITISDGAETFDELPCNLGSWDLHKCPECERMVPEMTSDNNKINTGKICVNCLKHKLEEKAEKLNSASNDILREAIEKKTFTLNLSKDVHNFLADRKVCELTPEETEEFFRMIRERYRNLSKKGQKQFLYECPFCSAIIAETIDGKEEKPWTPYECWKDFCYKITEKFRSGIDRKDLNNTSAHAIKPVTDKQTGRKLNILEVSAPNYECAVGIWRNSQSLFFSYDKHYKNEPYCILLRCIKSDLEQYLVDGLSDHRMEVMEILGRYVGQEKKILERTTIDQSLGYNHDDKVKAEKAIKDTIQSYISNKGLKEENSALEKIIVQTYEMRERDFAEFESAKSFIQYNISFPFSKEHFQGLLDTIEEAHIESRPHCIRVYNELDGMIRPFLGNLFSGDEEHEQNSESVTAGRTNSERNIFRIVVGKNGDASRADYTMPENEEESESLSNIVREQVRDVMKNEKFYERVISDAVLDYLEVYPDGYLGKSLRDKYANCPETNIKNNKSEPAMNEKDIYEMTNPGSANEAAGKLTTRELLTELKARGYRWEKLSKMIEVDFNEV